MTVFTESNTDGFNNEELEILNVAFDEAWGAIKGGYQREEIELDAAQMRKVLVDAINDCWSSRVNTSERLAENALISLGMVPVRDNYSLEIEM